MPIKWEISKAPTGPFRSFEHRDWPMGYLMGKPVARITCSDSYSARVARDSDHDDLTVLVADWRKESNPDGGAFTWRKLKGRFSNLDAAKNAANDFLLANYHFLEFLGGSSAPKA